MLVERLTGMHHVLALASRWLLLAVLAGACLPGDAAPARSLPPEHRLEVPELTIEESQAQFEQRRRELLERRAQPEDVVLEVLTDLPRDLLGNTAIANVVLGRFVPEANSRIRRVARWFDDPHPAGRDPRGESSIAATKLCRAYYLAREHEGFEPETLEAIERFFLTQDFESRHRSEGHVVRFRVTRYLMAQAFADQTFEAYDRTGRELMEEDAQWIQRFVEFRGRRGWATFDSTGYLGSSRWTVFANLYDFSDDPAMRNLARMVLDKTLLDIVLDSLHGLHGGAQGRVRANAVMDHALGHTYPLQYLLIGNVDAATAVAMATHVEVLTSDYRPPAILLDIALNRTRPYVNRERRPLHNVDDVLPENPLEGSIRKYTHWTPRYLMGAVQCQDPYPDIPGAWFAHHQQHQWGLSIGTRTRARVFTHHPGTTGAHGYWTGDVRCGCGHFFQHKNALVALYDIPSDQEHQWIHAYVPRAAFDRLEERAGFIFIQEGDVLVALSMRQGHEWTTEGRWEDVEVVSEGSRHAVICEVATTDEVGSMEAFQEQILSNPIDFDEESMNLTYDSARNGKLRIDTRGTRERDGEAVDLDYDTFDSPYAHAAWDSGVIEITKGNRRLVLDFPDSRRTLYRDGEVVDEKP